MDQAERDIRDFEQAARRAQVEVVIDKGVSAAIGQSKKILDGNVNNPAISTAQQLALDKAAIQNFETVQKTFAVTFEDLEKCLLPNSGCSMTAFMNRQNEAMQRWMQSFLSDGTQTALNRVRAARSLMQTYVTKLAGDGVGSLSAAIGCIADYQERAAAPRTPDAGSPTTAAPAKGGGVPVRAIVGLAVAGVGGVAAYEVVKNGLPNLSDFGGTDGSGSGSGSGGSGAMTYSGGASFVCTYNAGGVVNSCSGSVITVHVTVSLPVGTSLKLFTDNIFSTGAVTTTTNPPGDVTFRGFSGGGWFNQCGPPITRLTLGNLNASGNSVASISGLSIPITCR